MAESRYDFCGMPRCPECAEHALDKGNGVYDLIRAAYNALGVESDDDGPVYLQRYFDAFHERGHVTYEELDAVRDG